MFWWQLDSWSDLSNEGNNMKLMLTWVLAMMKQLLKSWIKKYDMKIIIIILHTLAYPSYINNISCFEWQHFSLKFCMNTSLYSRLRVSRFPPRVANRSSGCWSPIFDIILCLQFNGGVFPGHAGLKK